MPHSTAGRKPGVVQTGRLQRKCVPRNTYVCAKLLCERGCVRKSLATTGFGIFTSPISLRFGCHVITPIPGYCSLVQCQTVLQNLWSGFLLFPEQFRSMCTIENRTVYIIPHPPSRLRDTVKTLRIQYKWVRSALQGYHP